MFKIFIVFFLISLIFAIPWVESFKIKKETVETVLKYPRDSIDPLFDATFKPECCPSTYTSSSGCLCYEPKNFNLLATRGGNSLSNPL